MSFARKTMSLYRLRHTGKRPKRRKRWHGHARRRASDVCGAVVLDLRFYVARCRLGREHGGPHYCFWTLPDGTHV